MSVVWVWYGCGDCTESKMSHLVRCLMKTRKKNFSDRSHTRYGLTNRGRAKKYGPFES